MFKVLEVNEIKIKSSRTPVISNKIRTPNYCLRGRRLWTSPCLLIEHNCPGHSSHVGLLTISTTCHIRSLPEIFALSFLADLSLYPPNTLSFQSLSPYPVGFSSNIFLIFVYVSLFECKLLSCILSQAPDLVLDSCLKMLNVRIFWPSESLWRLSVKVHPSVCTSAQGMQIRL